MKYAVIISGPTASGKTSLSLELTKELSKQTGLKSQVINADIGQFYTTLQVGTAKPDWQNMPIQHHLFDVLDKPEDLNVIKYRSMVIDKINKIWKQGELPIIVGGSLFYIRSLFFPPTTGGFNPLDGPDTSTELTNRPDKTTDLWEQLNQIDPERAQSIHPNDRYRIERALSIWETTGKKPSSLGPSFEPPFHSRIIFIDLPRELLFDRINRRTKQMLLRGWLEEVEKLKGTEWEPFLKRKKLIGYPEIFDWIDKSKPAGIEELVELIQQKTRQYAKRQITFWKKFHNLLIYYSTEDSHSAGRLSRLCTTETINSVDKTEIEAIIEHIKTDLQNFIPKQEKGEK